MSPKPRCATCPHAASIPRTSVLFRCELNPPIVVDFQANRDEEDRETQWGQPIVSKYDGCSHHPAFPHWIDDRKREEREQEWIKAGRPSIVY